MLSASKMISIFAKILTKAQKKVSRPQGVNHPPSELQTGMSVSCYLISADFGHFSLWKKAQVVPCVWHFTGIFSFTNLGQLNCW